MMTKLPFLALLLSLSAAAAPVAAQEPPAPLSAPPAELDHRAEAYEQFMLGHYYAELYDATARSEYATRAIEHYKRAYELDPRSSVIGERLAEIYARSQRLRDAVLEAQEIIRRDPENLAARRLLARIYVRSLGNLTAADRQRDLVSRAIEQYREIARLDPDDSEAVLSLARLLRVRNEDEEAERVLRGLLDRQPEHELALDQWTQLLLRLDRAGEAIERLQQVAQRAPTSRLLGLLGDSYFQLREFGAAEQAFSRAMELDPSDVELRRALARALLLQEKTAEALEQYRRLAELEPADPDVHLRLAQIYRHQRELDLAEEHLLRAREAAPGNLEVIYNEALLYEAQGRFDDAIRVLNDSAAALRAPAARSADMRRTLAILYEQLGRLYREVQDFDAALNSFRELVALGGQEERRGRLLLSDTLRLARRLNPALEESRRALELFPGDAALETNHALLLAEKGDVDQATARLLRRLGRRSEDRQVYLTLAQVYERARRFPEAEQAARMAESLAAEPSENEVAWFLLGAIFERQKKFDRAEEYFRRVLDVNPRHAATLNYFGYMLADRGVRLEQAVELVQRALDEEPNNGHYLDSLGWAYYQMERYEEAERYLRRAVERAGREPVILSHLGDLFYRTGRIQQAAQLWERAVTEWHRVLPADFEPEKLAALEKKLADLKHRLAQAPAGEIQPR
jgi:tetratricopeptide (TPR) repeat protein